MSGIRGARVRFVLASIILTLCSSVVLFLNFKRKANQSPPTPSLRPVSVLLELLKSEDPTVAIQAASELGYWGPAAGSAVPPLIEALDGPDRFCQSGDRSLKSEASSSLARIGSEAVEPLLLRLKSTDRTLVIGTLYSIAYNDSDALHRISSALLDPDPKIREGVAVVLGACGEKAKDAIPDLVRATEDPDSVVSNAAEKALDSIAGKVGRNYP